MKIKKICSEGAGDIAYNKNENQLVSKKFGIKLS